MKPLDLPVAFGHGRRQRLLILAPHLNLPLRNGADVYIWNKWQGADPFEWDVTLIAADGTYALTQSGAWRPIDAAPDATGRSRWAALLAMIIQGVDYLSAKFNTPAYLSQCRRQVLSDFDLVVCSFPSTYRLAVDLGIDARRLILETHNFDPKLYLDRALELRGVKRLMAALSAARSHALLKLMPKDMPLVALGPADSLFFRAMGFTRVIQGKLGFESRGVRQRFPGGTQARLLFVGSLSTVMNETVVREFVSHCLADLRRHVSRSLLFSVAGSRPSRKLSQFLREHGVALHENPSDDELASLLQNSHATVLPFTNSNGLKLKFGMSASHGVPILSFIEAPDGLDRIPGILVSRSMSDWADWLNALVAHPQLEEEYSVLLQDAAARQGWHSIVRQEMAQLSSMAETRV